MELDAVQGEGVDAGNVFQQGLPRFARQSQDEMPADRDTTRGRLLHGLFRAGEGVPPVNSQQRFIPAGLNSVLHPRTPERSDIIQLLRVYAIGSCADDNPGNGRMRQRLPVNNPQSVKRSVRVGKRLKIRQIRTASPAPCRMKGDPFIDLLRNALLRRTVRRMKRRRVAERASSVRASKSCVHHQLQPRLFRGPAPF